MPMNASEQQRFNRELFPNLSDAISRLLTLQIHISAALQEDNVSSLRKAKKKATGKPQDQHTIDQHEGALKTLKPFIDTALTEMTDIALGKETIKRYDSLTSIGKAHPKLLKSGDSLHRLEPEFLKSLKRGEQSFYYMRASYANASMVTIGQRFAGVFQILCQGASSSYRAEHSRIGKELLWKASEGVGVVQNKIDLLQLD